MALKKLDKITLWRKTGSGAFNEGTFNSPVEIEGRWDESLQKSRDDSGAEITYRGTILHDVEGLILVGDLVMLKPLSEIVQGDMEKAAEARVVNHYRNGAGTKSVFEVKLTSLNA